jgi:hypothetical protein
VITCVPGAPGSGKTTVATILAELLPTHVVLDWDAFMGPAAALADREIRQHPETWPAYRGLPRAVGLRLRCCGRVRRSSGHRHVLAAFIRVARIACIIPIFGVNKLLTFRTIDELFTTALRSNK